MFKSRTQCKIDDLEEEIHALTNKYYELESKHYRLMEHLNLVEVKNYGTEIRQKEEKAKQPPFIMV